MKHHFPLIRDIATTAGARIYSTLASMATLILTARWLGPEGRGVAVVAMTWVTLFGNIGHLSLSNVCVHRAANEEGDDWVGPAVGALLTVTATVTLIGWLVALILYWVAGASLFHGISPLVLALAFAALPFQVWEQYGSALLTIVGRLKTYNINQIVARTVGLIAVVVAIKLLRLGVYGFLAGFFIAQATVASAGITVLLRHARGRLKGGLAAIRAFVRDGIKVHLNVIGVFLYSGADIIMMQYFRGPAETGIFQLPVQLFLALMLVPQAALLTLQGRVAGRGRAEFWREHKAIMGIVVAGMALIAAVLWLIAPWLILLLGGQSFAASTGVLRILVFGLPAASFSTLMAIQWITRGYFLQASLLTLGMGIFNCTLNLFLIPRFGAQGAALATVIGYNLISVGVNLTLAWMINREARLQEEAIGAINRSPSSYGE